MACMILNDNGKDRQLINLSAMKPCQIGRIVDETCEYNGNIVLRTQCLNNFEVLDLTNFREELHFDYCIEKILVELLPKGEKITVEFSND